MKTEIRVVIADDYPVVRKGIRELLERTNDIQVVGEASTGEETLTLAKKTGPDVLLLDLELPDMKGTEVARQLHQCGSSVKILVLTAHDDPLNIHELIEAGVMGYLVKLEAPQVIVEAVRGVAQGEQGWISRSIAAQLVSWARGDEEDGVKFTRREMDVIRMVTKGKTNQEIAALLGIGKKSVEKHLSAIFQKLGVNSRTEVAVFAVREGLV